MPVGIFGKMTLSKRRKAYLRVNTTSAQTHYSLFQLPVQRQPGGCQPRTIEIERINSLLRLVDRDPSVMASLLIHTNLESVRTLFKTKDTRESRDLVWRQDQTVYNSVALTLITAQIIG
jgi:hypothetical protein